MRLCAITGQRPRESETVPGLSQQILRTDASGMPLEWIDFRQAARLYFLGMIAYACGEYLFTLHGGINARSRRPSTIEINSIVATFGNHRMRESYTPPLNNHALFQRDDHICLYCGERFRFGQLSRDHVTPISQGGQNQWTNVVTACTRCNHHKAGRTPEQAEMELLAIPFSPTHAEYIFLQGRNVLADQMAFLRAHFPRSSPLRERLDSDDS